MRLLLNLTRNAMHPSGCVVIIVLLAAISASAQDFAKWRYYRSIDLDTSALGANVNGDVRNYPVGVALNANNFDFNQATKDESDIRFSGEQKAKPLPHHIEHWDRATRTALVSVKVAVVKGNNASQAVFIHRGNAEAADAGDSKAVFDAKGGFVGVWHFNEDGNTAEAGYKCATANATDGTGVEAGQADGRTTRQGARTQLR